MHPSETRIVIVDDNTEFLQIISEYLSCIEGFRLSAWHPTAWKPSM